MTRKEIIAKAAAAAGISPTLAGKAYAMYWKAVKRHIESLPLKGDVDAEWLESAKATVSVPRLGKLGFRPDRFLKFKEAVKDKVKRK